MFVYKDNVFRISVRNIVEFVFSSGDIDSKGIGITDVKAMQEGARIHRKIQKSMGSRYHAEVMMKHKLNLTSKQGSDYNLVIEGRADGIIADYDEDEDGNKTPNGPVIIDEIKTMQTDVSKMSEAVYVHKAQAYLYAYIYALQNKVPSIGIWITYCFTETEEIKRFEEEKTYEELSEWFDKLISNFKIWTDFVYDEREKRQESIEGLEFPYDYREGQKKLCVSVYRTIKEEKNLFIQAPTGVGKTLSTVYPSVMAMGQGYADKIFYLTSKTITRTVAEEAFSLLRKKMLHFRTVSLTAKDKICILEERKCNPNDCEYAKGHYDRVNDAVFDMITNELEITRQKVMEYSKKHRVCPFEMSLDASNWCDGIICDYNYLFDPDASLKRYFGEQVKGDYVFLIDEAHNLVDRARQMYSARLIKEDFLKTKKLIKEKDKKLAAALDKCNKQFLELKRECENYKIVGDFGSIIYNIERVYILITRYMEKHKGNPELEDLLEFFFSLRHFLNMYDCADEKYISYAEHDDNGDFAINLFCVDPSGNISDCISQGRATVFFSATLLPVNYFKEMLSGNTEDYAVYANSPFNPDMKRVVISKDATSRYIRRNEAEYRKICRYIYEVTGAKPGNYMVFFPSYQYMESVFDIYSTEYSGNVVMQNNRMTEKDREDFLREFETNVNNPDGIIGFCVLGGIFSEGIDLKNESLIGSIIIGTGLPMICRERNIIREYFDSMNKDGYKYAYVIPGMNKVLQAAGRVIRTDKDMGVIILLDDRFLSKEYEAMFPREWNVVYPVTVSEVSDCVSFFWEKFD